MIINRIIGLVVYFFIAINILAGQQTIKISKDSVVHQNRKLITDVFVLNTCDPYEVSLRKRFDDDSIYYVETDKKRNLEIRAGA